jgi:hypothetical protein
MITLKIEKMIEYCLRWHGYAWRKRKAVKYR